MPKPPPFLPAVLAALVPIACVDDPSAPETSAQLITGGEPDLDTFADNTTVFIGTASGGACSGTVIGSRQVLTAAHCLTRPTAPWEPPNIAASTFDGVDVWAASDEPDPTPTPGPTPPGSASAPPGPTCRPRSTSSPRG